MKRSNLLLSCLALAAVVVAGLASPAPAGEALPFKGTFEGVHVSRTPLAPPRFADVFEATGQATQLGQLEMVIEDPAVLTRPWALKFAYRRSEGDRLIHDVMENDRTAVEGDGLTIAPPR